MTPDPITIDESAKLSDAYDRMQERRIMHLPVMRGGTLVGLISERHLRDAMPAILTLSDPAARRRSLSVTPVSRVMVSSPVTVEPTTPVLDAIPVMRRLRAGSLPVLESGKLVGIVTSGDLVTLLEKILRDAT